MTTHRPCTDPACGTCAQARATAGFRGEQIGEQIEEVGRMVTCPKCSHRFDPDNPAPVRVTENAGPRPRPTPARSRTARSSTPTPATSRTRRRGTRSDTEDHVRAAWSYINKPANAGKYSAADLKKVRARIKAAMKRLDITVSENSTTEALINGKRSFDDVRELVRRAVRARINAEHTDSYCWAYIIDLTDTDLVYVVDGDRLYQCTYTLDGTVVTLGDPVEVERTYAPVTSHTADESGSSDAGGETAAEGLGTRVELGGTARVLEAKGTDAAGNRIFRVRIIAYGDSKNARRYPEAVLRKAAPMYENAKAFDHHRTTEEMSSGTIQGLVGYYRSVEAADLGLEADLVLLPSATQAAEALDAAVALEGTDPLVGISHDAYALFRPIEVDGRQMQEATQITSVNSADIVSHPAAGGQATGWSPAVSTRRSPKCHRPRTRFSPR